MRLAMIKCLVRFKYPHENKLQSIDRTKDFYLSRRDFNLVDAEIADYERQLKELKFADLRARFEEALTRVSPAERQWAERCLEMADVTGSWSEIDYGYWVGLPNWKIDEAVALSFGCNPEIVDLRRIEKKRPETLFTKTYQRRHTLLERTFVRKLYNGRIKPVQLLTWATETDEPVDPILLQHLNGRFSTELGNFTAIEGKSALVAKLKAVEAERVRLAEELTNLKAGLGLDPVYPRHRRTYLTVILGLVEHKLGSKDEWFEGPSVSQVRKVLETPGDRLKDETIRDFIREVQEFLANEEALRSPG